MPPKRKPSPPPVDPVAAKEVELHVAASIRKSMSEWHAMVEAARQGPTRNAPPAYQGHDH